MFRGKTALTALRWLTCFVMTIGLIGTVAGLLWRSTIPLFMFDVPTWIIPLSAAYMGLRYWRRIPELENKIAQNQNFSWKNFSFRKSR